MSNACLNCGAALQGPFCSACGQRAVPPDPTVSELAGDAWEELSGYDGRIAATARGLLRPGFLTAEYMAGRRARYLSPIRLYVIVSVVYFVVAAAAPNITTRTGEINVPGGVRIGVGGSKNPLEMTDEDRQKLLASAERAPALVKPLLVSVARDPAGFRARVLTIMPRVFFALLPVFGAIVAVFYRGRRFPTALVFAAHLHAFAFAVFTLSEASKLLGSIPLAVAAGTVVTFWFAAYALVAARRVFGGGWLITIVKAVGVGALYLLASLPAFAVILVWAVLS
jgi:uncharacterized protein DUF3667